MLRNVNHERWKSASNTVQRHWPQKPDAQEFPGRWIEFDFLFINKGSRSKGSINGGNLHSSLSARGRVKVQTAQRDGSKLMMSLTEESTEVYDPLWPTIRSEASPRPLMETSKIADPSRIFAISIAIRQPSRISPPPPVWVKPVEPRLTC